MKKILAFSLVIIVLMGAVACAPSKTDEGTHYVSDVPDAQNTEVSNSLESSKGKETDPPITEPVVYVAHLPEDIILTKGDAKTSIINKRAHDIFDEMGLPYKSSTRYDESEYVNGVPYTLFHTGEGKNNWTFIMLTEWFRANYESVFLHRITVDFGAHEFPDDITILGFDKTSTKEDVFNTLGSPHHELKKIGHGTGTWYTYSWYNVTIGETVVPSIDVEFAEAGLYSIRLDLN